MVDQLTMKEILAEPKNLEELYVPENLVIDLIFRLLHNEGNVALTRFNEVLKVAKSIIDEILLWMQKEHLVEVSKASVQLGRLGNVYSLTDAGQARAMAAMDRSQYVGPVPVSIPYYNRAVEIQTNKRQKVSPKQVKNRSQPPDPAGKFRPYDRSGGKRRKVSFPIWTARQWKNHYRFIARRNACRH